MCYFGRRKEPILGSVPKKKNDEELRMNRVKENENINRYFTKTEGTALGFTRIRTRAVLVRGA